MENFWTKVWNLTPLWRLQNWFKEIYCNQNEIESSTLGNIKFFKVKSLFLVNFPKLNNLCDVINSDLDQKDLDFVYYISTVAEKSSSITLGLFTLHFWGQFFKIMKLWAIPNPLMWRHPKFGQKESKFVYEVPLMKKNIFNEKLRGAILVLGLVFKIFKSCTVKTVLV